MEIPSSKLKKKHNHGTFNATTLTPRKKSIHFDLSFGEAAKLGVALQSALLEVVRTKKTTKIGKNHVVHFMAYYEEAGGEANFKVWDKILK